MLHPHTPPVQGRPIQVLHSIFRIALVLKLSKAVSLLEIKLRVGQGGETLSLSLATP